jgi:hypothetical protein
MPSEFSGLAAPQGVDPTVFLLVKQIEKQHASASTERREQTEQFTTALDTLGGRFETKMDAQTSAMVGAARLAAGVVVIALALLGSIAGAVTFFKGGGIQIGTNHGEPTTFSPVAAPVPEMAAPVEEDR